jgi:hypothetical protein
MAKYSSDMSEHTYLNLKFAFYYYMFGILFLVRDENESRHLAEDWLERNRKQIGVWHEENDIELYQSKTLAHTFELF